LHTVIGAIAGLKRGLITERVKDGFAFAQAHGTWSGRPIGRPRLDADFMTICDALYRRQNEPGVIINKNKKFIVSRGWMTYPRIGMDTNLKMLIGVSVTNQVVCDTCVRAGTWTLAY